MKYSKTVQGGIFSHEQKPLQGFQLLLIFKSYCKAIVDSFHLESSHAAK